MACTATKSTSPRLGLGREGESPNRVGYMEEGFPGKTDDGVQRHRHTRGMLHSGS